MKTSMFKTTLLILTFLPSVMFAQTDAKGDEEIQVKDSSFRFQAGLTLGVQANPISTDAIIQRDVQAMTTTVINTNKVSTSSTDPATVKQTSSAVYGIPVGLTVQTIFFDFMRLRFTGTYDFSVPAINQYSDKSSGREIVYTSEISVRQLQFPLLAMFDVPISDANTIYLGGGVTTFYGEVTKKITEERLGTNPATLVDEDRIAGWAFGPTFIIGIQRRFTENISISGDLLFQSGTRGGFVDKTRNAATDNNPSGFDDLSGVKGDEKRADGSFNDGTPRIMNYEGIRFLISANMHLDF